MNDLERMFGSLDPETKKRLDLEAKEKRKRDANAFINVISAVISVWKNQFADEEACEVASYEVRFIDEEFFDELNLDAETIEHKHIYKARAPARVGYIEAVRILRDANNSKTFLGSKMKDYRLKIVFSPDHKWLERGDKLN